MINTFDEVIYKEIISNKQKGRKMLAILIDPDKFDAASYDFKKLQHADFIFVGGSTVEKGATETSCLTLKKHLDKPIIIFPGDCHQITKEADAMLFTSLISGRNSDYLIDQQVQGANILSTIALETISCGYILISSGKKTSVERVSETSPINRENIKLAADTAFAGQLLGMKSIYLEAGSGADSPVPPSLIKAVRKTVSGILIVGGGIRTDKQCDSAWDAGADIVVMGTVYELM